jgi:hypothetical protein
MFKYQLNNLNFSARCAKRLLELVAQSFAASFPEARPAPPRRPPPRPPLPPPRTKWTRRVPQPVLIRHAASLTPY